MSTESAIKSARKIEFIQARMQDATESAKANAMDAITTMRRFLNDAERSLSDERAPVDYKMLDRVRHALAWGSANAHSNLETAGGYVAHLSELQIQLLEAQMSNIVENMQDANKAK